MTDDSAATRSPRRPALALLAVIGFVMTVALSFPGHTNFDEWYALGLFWSGELSDVLPPFHTLVWASTIELGRLMGLNDIWQASILLFLGAAMFWFIAWAFARHLTLRWLGLLSLLILLTSPMVIIYTGHSGKDTHFVIALFGAVMLMHLAYRRRAFWLLMGALVPLFVAFALRNNGPAAVAPLAVVWAGVFISLKQTAPSRWPKRLLRIASLATVLLVGMFALNKAINKIVVVNPCCETASLHNSMLYDLVGISYYAGVNVVPPLAYGADPSYNMDVVKRAYNTIYYDGMGLRIVRQDDGPELARHWIRMIGQYPSEFVRHRFEIMKNLFGFRSGNPSLPAAWGFFLGHPIVEQTDRMERLRRSFEGLGPRFVEYRSKLKEVFDVVANWSFFRLWPYGLAALISFIVFPPRRWSDPSVWLVASALAYAASYFIAVPAASFRYVYWSAFALLIATLFRVDDGLARRRQGSDRMATPDTNPPAEALSPEPPMPLPAA